MVGLSITSRAMDTVEDKLDTVNTKLDDVRSGSFPSGTWASASDNHTFSAAGTTAIITITPASGETIYIGDIMVGGEKAGYGYIEWNGTQVWGKMYFPDNCCAVQQFVGKINNGFVGDGTKKLVVKVYLSAAGEGSASITYITVT